MKKDEEKALQSIKEEIINSITHGLGTILSIIALVILIYKSMTKGTTRHVVSCSLYGSSLIVLYLFSTLYHAITHQTAKKILRRFDHISIYLLITGTYMPITLVALRGWIGWTLFGLQCGFCLIGVLFKSIFGPRLEKTSTLFYLLMGCLALIVIKPLISALTFKGTLWVLWGGFFYVLGIFFFAIDKKVKYFHAVWHLFVLLGSLCHFFMVYLYIIPLMS